MLIGGVVIVSPHFVDRFVDLGPEGERWAITLVTKGMQLLALFAFRPRSPSSRGRLPAWHPNELVGRARDTRPTAKRAYGPQDSPATKTADAIVRIATSASCKRTTSM